MVEGQLGAIAGVSDVKAHCASGTATVSYNPDIFDPQVVLDMESEYRYSLGQ